MTETSARLALPLLQAGQAQKEIYHNEALTRLDLIVAATVQSVGLDAPPTAPDLGECWIVGSAPTGAWGGQAGTLAGWTSAGWRFVAVPDGTQVWSVADALWARRSSGAWSIGEELASSVRIGGVQVVKFFVQCKKPNRTRGVKGGVEGLHIAVKTSVKHFGNSRGICTLAWIPRSR